MYSCIIAYMLCGGFCSRWSWIAEQLPRKSWSALKKRLTKADGSLISYPDSSMAVWKSTVAVSFAFLSSLSAFTFDKRSKITGWLGLISNVFLPDIIWI